MMVPDRHTVSSTGAGSRPIAGPAGSRSQAGKASGRRRGSFFLFLFFLLLPAYWIATPTLALAKDKKKAEAESYALIYGTVWSAQGQPVPGVKVKIRRADQSKARWELVSNDLGEFAQRVPAGKADYVVWTDAKGKKKESPRAETRVHIDHDERADIGLHLTE